MESESPPKRVTIVDMARALNLSKGAVSRALRDDRTISAATRARVKAMAAELSYQPNPMAAGLVAFRHGAKHTPVRAAIAWLNFWPDPKKMRTFAEFDRNWKGASASAEKHGYHLEEFVVNKSMSLARLEQVLIARGINGILVPPLGIERVDWTGFGMERFSVVMMAKVDTPVLHYVGPHQLWNAMYAFEQMRRRGYQRIGFVGDIWHAWNFVPGYFWAQASGERPDWQIPPFLRQGSELSNSQKELLAWLKKWKPDAILTGQPQLPAVLAKLGYRVPEDIGLAALTVLDCPIDAGIYQNPEETGRVSVLVLISLLHDIDRGIPAVPREVLIKGRWVDGASLPARN